MCEFCTMIPISLFITKIQNLKWGCKTFWRVLYVNELFRNRVTRATPNAAWTAWKSRDP
jgi:hypothetical protein